MKKLFVLAASFLLVAGSFARPVDVSEKVKRIFHESFSKAQDVQWSEVKPDNYEVSFSLSGVLSKIIYDQNGEILSSLRYYSPENLPVHIYSKLKKKYEGKTFFGVTEISNDQSVAYYIKLHDDKFWYTIKSDSEGNLELTEKMKRADLGVL